MLYWFDRNSILRKESRRHERIANKNASTLRYHADHEKPMEPEELIRIYSEMRARYNCVRRIRNLIA